MNNEHLLLIEDENDYHARSGEEFLSSHLLGTFRHCPFMYKLTVDGKYRRPDSNAYILGRAAHALILEGEQAYANKWCSDSPINPKTGRPYGNETKKFTEWASEVRAWRQEPISADDNVLAWKLYKSVSSHKLASELLTNAPFRERVVRSQVIGVDCQSRMDAFGFDVGLVDLKTCETLEKLMWQVKNFGYIEQLSFYRSVLRAAGIDCPAVYIIGVEKQFPQRTGVWKIEEGSLDLAEESNQQAITKLCRCKGSGVWPTGYEEERIFSI